MANQPIGLDEACPGEAPILVVVGDGAEPSMALLEAIALRDVLEALGAALRQKDIDARPSPNPMRVVAAPARLRA